MLLAQLHRLFALLHVWYLRRRSRRWLLQLDARQLRDIGVSADEARIEGRKPFWQA